jgi:hypothetical protein
LKKKLDSLESFDINLKPLFAELKKSILKDKDLKSA